MPLYSTAYNNLLFGAFRTFEHLELLLILDEYWSEHPELHDTPIYYASSLAKKCMSVYQTYTEAMNHSIRKQMNKRNPFKFKHITNLKSIEQFDDQVPSVVLGNCFQIHQITSYRTTY